jgi:hypothetical protein
VLARRNWPKSVILREKKSYLTTLSVENGENTRLPGTIVSVHGKFYRNARGSELVGSQEICGRSRGKKTSFDQPEVTLTIGFLQDERVVSNVVSKDQTADTEDFTGPFQLANIDQQ